MSSFGTSAPLAFKWVVVVALVGGALLLLAFGPRATELISECVTALKLETTAAELYRAIHPHPTLSEALMEAAHGVAGHPIHI